MNIAEKKMIEGEGAHKKLPLQRRAEGAAE